MILSSGIISFLYRLSGNILLCVVLGIISILVGGLIPKDIDYTKFPFRPFKWEKYGRSYNKIKITSWKDKLPDLSKHISIFRKKINYKREYNHFLIFVRETCISELVHIFLIVISPIYIYVNKDELGIWICIINIIGNFPFIMVQRYNRPRLVHTLEKHHDKLVLHQNNSNTSPTPNI